ncbi:hypothetical protein EV121DRAFT_298085 [Schizophyllum commune]
MTPPTSMTSPSSITPPSVGQHDEQQHDPSTDDDNEQQEREGGRDRDGKGSLTSLWLIYPPEPAAAAE